MYFTADNGNIDGFNEPIAVAVGGEAGPFRSSGTILRRVGFDSKKLSRRDREFISSLPKGVAIVGGFARGMYLGDMYDVGDIDLAVYVGETVADWNEFLNTVEKFLEERGYKMIDKCTGYGAPPLHFLNIKRKTYLPPYGWGIPRWNCEPIKTKWFRMSKREVDVLASSSQELFDFLKLFDITICQFAYLNGQLYATEAALADVAKKQFRVLRYTNPERARRYWRKGYNPVWDDLMVKVMRVATFDEAFAQKLKAT